MLRSVCRSATETGKTAGPAPNAKRRSAARDGTRFRIPAEPAVAAAARLQAGSRSRRQPRAQPGAPPGRGICDHAELGRCRGLRPVPALYDADRRAARTLPGHRLRHGLRPSRAGQPRAHGGAVLRHQRRASAPRALSAERPAPDRRFAVVHPGVGRDSTSTSRPTARAAAPVSTGTNSTAGSILDIGRGAKLSAGYQFTTVEPTAGLNEYHTIKLGFAFALN